MNEKLEKQLFNKYPFLYRGKNVPITENLMGFGFNCGDGWYDLIDKLSKFISFVVFSKSPVLKDFIVVQVKEKFGGLRFYTEGSNEMINWLIGYAENASYNICEECGKDGELRNELAWKKTLCLDCLKKT